MKQPSAWRNGGRLMKEQGSLLPSSVGLSLRGDMAARISSLEGVAPQAGRSNMRRPVNLLPLPSQNRGMPVPFHENSWAWISPSFLMEEGQPPPLLLRMKGKGQHVSSLPHASSQLPSPNSYSSLLPLPSHVLLIRARPWCPCEPYFSQGKCLQEGQRPPPPRPPYLGHPSP